MESLRDLKGRQKGERPAAKQTGDAAPLSRNKLYVAEKAFQWRTFGRNRIRSDDHILEMARALRESGDPLEPILVYRLGARFYVIDGHHRLAAYDTARWAERIPARVFDGSLEDAHREALKRNSRTQLPMTGADKINAAWRIVKKGDARDSIRSTMALTGVAKGTVNNMRRVWGQLNDGSHGKPKDLLGLTWHQARMKAEGQADYVENSDWRNRRADEIVAKLLNAKLIGDLTKNPDITALVIAKLDDDLPKLLMAEWEVVENEERPFDPHEEAEDSKSF